MVVIDDPWIVFKKYVTSYFFIDVIAVVPYSIFYPQLIFLRYFKLFKIYEFKDNFTALIKAIIEPYIEKSKQLSVIRLINLMVAILLTSHFFAVLWMVIG